jgi:dihydroneopterin aldolase
METDMDKIVFDSLEFHGHHGATEAQQESEQIFLVDAELFLNLKKAGETDKIKHTVSAYDVIEIMRDVLEKERYALLEAAADTICADILSEFPAVKRVTVCIKRPDADLGIPSESFGVQVTRKQ